MAGKGARQGRRLRRQAKLGPLVELISQTEHSDILSCGHEEPKGPARQYGPGKIWRHCSQCPAVVIDAINSHESTII